MIKYISTFECRAVKALRNIHCGGICIYMELLLAAATSEGEKIRCKEGQDVAGDSFSDWSK